MGGARDSVHLAGAAAQLHEQLVSDRVRRVLTRTVPTTLTPRNFPVVRIARRQLHLSIPTDVQDNTGEHAGDAGGDDEPPVLHRHGHEGPRFPARGRSRPAAGGSTGKTRRRPPRPRSPRRSSPASWCPPPPDPIAVRDQPHEPGEHGERRHPCRGASSFTEVRSGWPTDWGDCNSCGDGPGRLFARVRLCLTNRYIGALASMLH